MKVAFLTKNRPDVIARIPAGINHVLAAADENNQWAASELDKLRDVDALFVMTEHVNDTVLDAAKQTKIVQRLGVGYNTVDLDACNRHHIPCCNLAGVNKEAVAEMCFSLMLGLAKNLKSADAYTRETDWLGARQLASTSIELNGKTLGIIGLGAIGCQLARRACAFGMRIVYNDVRTIDPDIVSDLDARYLEKDELLQTADVVSINTFLNEQTRGMINKERIGMMKSQALLILTARGGIIDEQALADALNEDRLGGAGIDVFAIEPIEQTNPLLTAKRVLLTAHVAGPTPEASSRSWQRAIENVKAVVERGERPKWIVNDV